MTAEEEEDKISLVAYQKKLADKEGIKYSSLSHIGFVFSNVCRVQISMIPD